LAIEDLNAALTRQWHEIDRLTRQVALLTEQFQDIGAAPGGPALPEPPPPHY
jgi:SlyX protein